MPKLANAALLLLLCSANARDLGPQQQRQRTRVFEHRSVPPLWASVKLPKTLGAVFPAGREALRAVWAFDLPGTLYVDEIVVRSTKAGSPVAFELSGGSLHGRGVELLCWNDAGVPAGGAPNPWEFFSAAESLLASVDTTLEVAVARAFGRGTYVSNQLSGLFTPTTKPAGWESCRFKVSRYESFTISYDSASTAVTSHESVLDRHRVGQQLLALCLALIAPAVVDSHLLWCIAGGCGASVALSAGLGVMILRQFDSRSTGLPVVLLLGLGAGGLAGTFWAAAWKPILTAYLLCAAFGVVYCVRNKPGPSQKLGLQLALQAIAAWLAHSAISDSGAGAVAAAALLAVYLLVAQLISPGIDEMLVQLGSDPPAFFAVNRYATLHSAAEKSAAYHADGRANAERAVGELMRTDVYQQYAASQARLVWQRDRGQCLAAVGGGLRAAVLVGLAVAAGLFCFGGERC